MKKLLLLPLIFMLSCESSDDAQDCDCQYDYYNFVEVDNSDGFSYFDYVYSHTTEDASLNCEDEDLSMTPVWGGDNSLNYKIVCN